MVNDRDPESPRVFLTEKEPLESGKRLPNNEFSEEQQSFAVVSRPIDWPIKHCVAPIRGPPLDERAFDGRIERKCVRDETRRER